MMETASRQPYGSEHAERITKELETGWHGDKYLIVQRFITFLLSNIHNNNIVTTISSKDLSGSVAPMVLGSSIYSQDY